MYALSLRWRLFLLKYDRLSSGVGSRMENDTAPASGTRGASKLKAWRISATATALGLVALFFAWQWYDGHNRIGALRDELAQRVRESESDSRDARGAGEARADRAEARGISESADRPRDALPGAVAQSRRMGDRRNRADPHHCLAAAAAHR